MAVHPQNYTLGRGRIYFARFNTGTQVPGPSRFFGNCPELNLTAAVNTLDHFSSTSGVRNRDAQVQLDTTRSGTIVCDNISLENLALFFFGESSTFTDAGAAIVDELHADVIQGTYLQLGASAANPMGARGITGVSAKVGASVKTVNVDYEVDLVTGRVYIVPGGGIANLDDLLVSYTRSATTQGRVISGGTPIEGELRFYEENAAGTNRDLVAPYVKLSPNGDLSLIGEDWRRIPFSLEVLTKAGYPDIQISDRPA